LDVRGAFSHAFIVSVRRGNRNARAPGRDAEVTTKAKAVDTRMFHPVSIAVLGLTLFMSYRLYNSNRRNAYRLLLFSHTLFILHHVLEMALGGTDLAAAGTAQSFLTPLRTTAFVLVNFAVFTLYQPLRRRTRAWFYGLLAAAVLAGIPALAGKDSPLAGVLPDAWIGSLPDARYVSGIFSLILCPLFALMIAPLIRQPRKHIAGLAVFFLIQLAVLVDPAAQLDGEAGFVLGTAIALLPPVYYVLLFMLLFERVVELMMSMYRSSILDGLTGLYNRRFFMLRLEQMLKRKLTPGVIFCDIDDFKKLNDTLGHDVADRMLKHAADILAEEASGIGLAGRYGGEELVAFVFGDPVEVAERVRSRVEKETGVTVSVGICRARSGLSADQLLRRADRAMYHSKTGGKNRVTDFDSLPPSEDETLHGWNAQDTVNPFLERERRTKKEGKA